jgi:predicted nucleic acid-binding protein
MSARLPQKVILDSDVMIDVLRKYPDAVQYYTDLVKSGTKIYLSTITVGELYAGVKDGTERTELERMLSRSTIIPLSHDLAVKGGLLARQYRKSHGTGYHDAMIAATALEHCLTLITRNSKHYPMLTDMVVPYIITHAPKASPNP